MVRINLLPVKVSRKKEAGKQQLVLLAAAVAVVLVLNFFWAHQRAGVLKDLKSQVERKKAEIAQLEKIIGEVKNIRTQQDQLRQKLEILDKLKAGRSGPVKMLDELATITPKRLWLRKMEEKGGASITFDGTSATIDDVSALMAALKTSKHFGKVELKKTTARQEKGGLRLVDFTVTASVTYGGLVAQAEGSGQPAPGGAAGAPPAPAAGRR
jgi:type IV pilus assembly protein PilN